MTKKNNKGFKATEEFTKLSRAEELAKEFHRQFEKWSAYDFPADDLVNAWLYEKYIPVLRRGYPEVPCKINFRSSGTGACPRELALMAMGKKADKRKVHPMQYRWCLHGSALGDTIQLEVLRMEKHYQRLTGETFNFRFERVENDAPHFEQFSTKYITYKHQGVEFSTGGSVDGVMIYTDPITMEETRLGLEVKSKQTSYAMTGNYSMREANAKHVQQVTNYGILHDLDYCIILYVNMSHKSWNIKPEDYAKYNDVRAFGIDITKEMKEDVIDKFTDCCIAAVTGELPKLSLNDWLFNGYKKACALSLSYAELEELEEEATDKQQGIIEEIKKLRGDIL